MKKKKVQQIKNIAALSISLLFMAGLVVLNILEENKN